jgi:hypothetical protein
MNRKEEDKANTPPAQSLTEWLLRPRLVVPVASALIALATLAGLFAPFFTGLSLIGGGILLAGSLLALFALWMRMRFAMPFEPGPRLLDAPKRGATVAIVALILAPGPVFAVVTEARNWALYATVPGGTAAAIEAWRLRGESFEEDPRYDVGLLDRGELTLPEFQAVRLAAQELWWAEEKGTWRGLAESPRWSLFHRLVLGDIHGDARRRLATFDEDLEKVRSELSAVSDRESESFAFDQSNFDYWSVVDRRTWIDDRWCYNHPHLAWKASACRASSLYSMASSLESIFAEYVGVNSTVQGVPVRLSQGVLVWSVIGLSFGFVVTQLSMLTRILRLSAPLTIAEVAAFGFLFLGMAALFGTPIVAIAEASDRLDGVPFDRVSGSVSLISVSVVSILGIVTFLGWLASLFPAYRPDGYFGHWLRLGLFAAPALLALIPGGVAYALVAAVPDPLPWYQITLAWVSVSPMVLGALLWMSWTFFDHLIILENCRPRR